MANEQNLKPFTSEQDREEAKKNGRKGGVASGKARRERATMKKTLEKMLDETYKKSGLTYREMATLGLIKGAVKGNAQNYKTILETLGELKALEIDLRTKELTKVEELLNKIENEANK